MFNKVLILSEFSFFVENSPSFSENIYNKYWWFYFIGGSFQWKRIKIGQSLKPKCKRNKFNIHLDIIIKHQILKGTMNVEWSYTTDNEIYWLIFHPFNFSLMPIQLDGKVCRLMFMLYVVIMIAALTPLKPHNTIELEEVIRVLTDFQLMCYLLHCDPEWNNLLLQLWKLQRRNICTQTQPSRPCFLGWHRHYPVKH